MTEHTPDRVPTTDEVRDIYVWDRCVKHGRNPQLDTRRFRAAFDQWLAAVIRAAQDTHRPPATPDQLAAIRELQQGIRHDLTHPAQDNNTETPCRPELADDCPGSAHRKFSKTIAVPLANAGDLARLIRERDAARAEVAALRATQPTREQVARTLFEHDNPNNVWLEADEYRTVWGTPARGPLPTYLARADAVLALYADPGHHA